MSDQEKLSLPSCFWIVAFAIVVTWSGVIAIMLLAGYEV